MSDGGEKLKRSLEIVRNGSGEKLPSTVRGVISPITHYDRFATFFSKDSSRKARCRCPDFPGENLRDGLRVSRWLGNSKLLSEDR